MTFRPMLAADISDQLHMLRYPTLVTPKFDGVRAIIRADGVWSRSMKLLPNKNVQMLAQNPRLHGLDGELIMGQPTAPDVYRVTQAACARVDGPMPTFFAFDCYAHPSETYHERTHRVLAQVDDALSDHVIAVDVDLAHSETRLLALEERFLSLGFEGLILRAPDAPYKQGRSTVREQGMLKLKRFHDGEAEIIGVEEEMHNGNAAQTSALGLTERSSHKAGLVGKGRMGALVVRDCTSDVEFKIGTGFDAADRERFWAEHVEQESVIGKIVKYKSFLIGVKDKPRFPVYLGLRSGWDL